MSVVQGSDPNEWFTAAPKRACCSVCGGPLKLPYASWMVSDEGVAPVPREGSVTGVCCTYVLLAVCRYAPGFWKTRSG
jgi:hypothetical protein